MYLDIDIEYSRDIRTQHSIKNDCLSLIPWNHFSSQFLWVLLTLVPAFLYGCSGVTPSVNVYSDSTETAICISGSCTTSEGNTLDVFTFEDDRLKRMDSYQRIENFEGDTAYISSTGGDKIFFICADSQKNRYGWAEVSSYSSLKDIYVELEKEIPGHLTKTGEFRACAGGQSAGISLRPLASTVRLDMIGSDFSGTPYADKTIEDVKVYLTNISASYPLVQEDNPKAVRIINTGMLNLHDVKRFAYKDNIVKEIQEDIGRTTIYPDINLLCYPNRGKDEGPGSPVTRLVIEGKIGGETYYWPINVGNGQGVERGCRYVYDLFIRRKGVTDPDIPIDIESIDINLKVKPWKEKEGYGVRF